MLYSQSASQQFHPGPHVEPTLSSHIAETLPCRFLKQEGLRVVHTPDVQAAKHAHYNSSRAAASRGPRQSTNEVLMVAPTAFGFNAQAAEDNSFMHSSTGDQTSLPTNQLRSTVLQEFSGLHRELSEVSFMSDSERRRLKTSIVESAND